MSSLRRIDFERWLLAQGAAPLGAKDYEFLRFRAHGMLCIVYEPNRKGRRSFVPDLARQAFEAWRLGETLDLTNEPEAETEDRKAMAAAFEALANRVKAGEDIDVDAEAATLSVHPRRLVVALRARHAIVPEFA